MPTTPSCCFENNPFHQITVGPANADIVGLTGRAIQMAVDALGARGGGIVRVLPGEYLLEDSIRLRPNITLRGDRHKTILRRGPLVWSPLALDADASQTEITPARIDGWKSGMGVCLWEKRTGWAYTGRPYIVTHIKDGVLYLNDHMASDRCAEYGGLVANYFPLVFGALADNAVVDGFTADAAVEDPEGVLKGMRNAVIYFFRSRNVTVRNVTARNGRGDGITFGKSSVGSTVEDCETSHNDCYGIHPGSHSRDFTMRRCDIHDNASDGLYICWGVVGGQFTDSRIYRNGHGDYRSGISIGHKDTDCLIARNHIYENKKYGVCFRQKTMGNAAHRATLRDNVIENNGSRPEEFAELKTRLQPWESINVGISVCGMTQDLVLENNVIRETRKGADRLQRHALYLHQGVSGLRMSGNRISGHPEAAIVDHSGGKNQLEELEPLAKA